MLNNDFDFDFDAQDENDAAEAESFRTLVTGLPARPGTRR